MDKEHKNFGFIEMIGSIVMLLFDPIRMDNKKYLQEKYYTLNRIIGIITLSVIICSVVFLSIKYLL